MSNYFKTYSKNRTIRRTWSRNLKKMGYRGIIYTEIQCPNCKRYFLGNQGLAVHLAPKIYRGCNTDGKIGDIE